MSKLHSLLFVLAAALSTVFPPAGLAADPTAPGNGGEDGITLRNWGKTLAVRSRGRPDVMICLWFYEWHMFDAVLPGLHTHSPGDYPWEVASDGSHAVMRPPGMTLHVNAVADGAELLLKVTNESNHDWPDLASLVPCLTPGSTQDPGANSRFLDDEHRRTYFLGPQGFAPLVGRDLHCNEELRAEFVSTSPDAEFPWSEKWPLSPDDAGGGLMVRQGREGRWIAGIAWERYLCSQGHNPWKCMHLAVRLGPLNRGESRSVRGRIFLFQGSKEQCLAKYRSWLEAK